MVGVCSVSETPCFLLVSFSQAKLSAFQFVSQSTPSTILGRRQHGPLYVFDVEAL